MSLYDKASLVLIPSGTKAGKVFSQKPTSGDGDFDSDDIPNLMRAVQGHIAKLNEKFIIMIFDHQNKLDNAMLNSLNVAVEGNIDRVGNDEMARRMRWGAENQEEENNNE